MDFVCLKDDLRTWDGRSHGTQFRYVCNICGQMGSFTVQVENSLVLMGAWEEIGERAKNHHAKEHAGYVSSEKVEGNEKV